jgi:YVTN family beta-propeller protein
VKGSHREPVRNRLSSGRSACVTGVMHRAWRAAQMRRRLGSDTVAMNGRTRRIGLSLSVAAGVLATGCAFTQPALEPITNITPSTIAIPPVAGQTAAIDIMVIDQPSHRLWVADLQDKGIDVFDLSNVPGQYVTTIQLDRLPKGLAIAPDLGRLYSGNDDSSVSVVDINPASATVNKVVATIPIDGPGPADLIEYDPKDHKVFVTSPDDGYISDIDVATNTVTAKISGLHFIDQPRFNPRDGMLYVGGTDDNTIDTIDPANDKLVSRAPIGVTCAPHGIAISPRSNRGVIGCSDRDEPWAVAWDFTTSRLVDKFDQSGAGDAVIYDAKVDQFFFGASNYAPPELSIFSDQPQVNYLTSVPSFHKSGTVAYDETHNLLITHDGRSRKAELLYYPNPVVGVH